MKKDICKVCGKPMDTHSHQGDWIDRYAIWLALAAAVFMIIVLVMVGS